MDIVRFLGVLLVYGQRAFIYPGSIPGIGPPVETVEGWRLPYEALTLETPDKAQLKALLFVQKLECEDASPIRTAATTDDEFASRRPTFIIFHGNAENYSHGIIFARVLYLRLRCNVILAEYRGYADCPGTPSESGIRIDSQTTLDFACHHPILSPTAKILYGLSLGGGVAIELASRNPDLIHGLAVENTFLSLPKMLPVLMPSLSKLKFLVRDKWRSEVNITKVPPTTPILFLSGAQDEIVPPAHMKELYELSKAENPDAQRTFVLFEKGTHNDTWQQPNYRKALRDFIGSIRSPASDPPLRSSSLPTKSQARKTVDASKPLPPKPI